MALQWLILILLMASLWYNCFVSLYEKDIKVLHSPLLLEKPRACFDLQVINYFVPLVELLFSLYVLFLLLYHYTDSIGKYRLIISSPLLIIVGLCFLCLTLFQNFPCALQWLVNFHRLQFNFLLYEVHEYHICTISRYLRRVK